jgi:NodT family efflux transporter outer membrane factor (OMF) lipoprotein
VKRAQASEAAARADLAAVDESIGLARNQIAALLGAGPDRGLTLPRPSLAAVQAFGLPANLAADLIGRRPDLVAARLHAEAASQRIKAAKADFYPNVNLSAAIGLQSFGLDKLARAGSVYGALGPAISLPIFSGGQIEGAYRGARADYDGAVASYNGVLVKALQDVADVVVSERALGERLRQSRAALAASDAAFQLASDRYREGLATYLDVLAAEDSLIANRRAVADLETRAFALDVALVRALGGGFHSSQA